MGFSIVGRPEQWEKWVEEWMDARGTGEIDSGSPLFLFVSTEEVGMTDEV